MLAILVLAAAAGAAASVPPSDPTAPPRVRAARASQPPVLDGRTDDLVWQGAPLAQGFIQKFPDEAAAPSEATSFRVLYDDDAIYVGVDCQQMLTPVRAVLTRRDREVEADRISVHIGSRRGDASAFQFGINAAGVLSDALQFDDNRVAPEWDENWEAIASQTGSGWSAEMRIPLRVLRFDAAATQDWAFNVRRVISLRQEISEWAFIPRTQAAEVSRYGRVEQLENLPARRQLALRPFVLGKMSYLQPGYGPVQGLRPGAAAGIDLMWQVLPQLTFEATALPDFGQVELDQVVLNLSTVETFYPEKRPFFSEGVDLFTTDFSLVHTRRIGETPYEPARLPDERAAGLLEPAPIYTAVKLTGRAADRLDLGIISAVTGETTQRVALPGGGTTDRVAAPLSLYNVLRLRHRVGQGGRLGLLATAVNRFERPSRYPGLPGASDPLAPAGPRELCPGGDELAPGARCFHDGYVGAVDGYWRSPSGDYVTRGVVALSLIQGGPPRAFRDGTVVASGDWDREFRFEARKEGGEHWLAGAWTSSTGRRFDRNDMGFMRRQNDWWLGGDVSYRTTRPFWRVLETRTSASAVRATNLDSLKIRHQLELGTRWKLRSFWTVGLWLQHAPARYDDREVGDGTALELAPLSGLLFGAASDPRREVQAGFDLQTGRRRGGLDVTASGRLLVRALPQLDLELLPELTVSRGQPRFVGSGTGGELVFAELDAAALGSTVRATYTFTPRLTLQSYLQLFFARKDYGDSWGVPAEAGGRGSIVHLRDLVTPATPADDPRLRQAILNVNVVLRWEYRLGSTLFLVYTRTQNGRPRDPFAPTIDLASLRRGRAADTLLLKLSRWWG
jgi:hypothetical protein